MKGAQQLKKQQLQFSKQLNSQCTIILTTHKKGQKYISKLINFDTQLPESQQLRNSNIGSNINLILKRITTINQSIICKPQYYYFEGKKFYILYQILPYNLQNTILFHRITRTQFTPWFIQNLAIKLYDSINRIKNSRSQFYHGNLKPSNIFFNLNPNQHQRQRNFQLQLKLTQFGIMTKYPNKFYIPLLNPAIKSRVNIPNSSSSNISFQYQNQIHALAIIIAEMITLWPIDKIYRKLQDKNGMNQLRKAMQIQTNKFEYKNNASNFVMAILQKKQNIKDFIQKFKNQLETPQYSVQQDFDQYVRWDLQRFNKLITDNPYNQIIISMKDYINRNRMVCFDVIKLAQKYDPQLYFILYDCEQLRQFLKQFQIKLKDKQLIQFFFYSKLCSGVNYIELIKKIFTVQQVIQGIIKTHLGYYETRKQFFTEKVGKNQQWRYQDVANYLKQLGVNYTLAQVKKVVNTWNNNKDALKYADFNKIFKDFGQQTLTSFKNQSKQKTQSKEHKLFDFLNRIQTILKQNNKNLISFFRSFDLTGRWYIQMPDLTSQVKKMVTLKQRQWDQLREQMLQVAGFVGQKNKLNYVILLKQTQICSLTQLFKLILCEKINEQGRQRFYRQYQKQSKGWNKNSLVDFNEKQQLQFTKAQMNTIFKDLDLDGSGFLSEKQLVFYLTGLKQFDKDFIIEKIKQQVAGKWDLFQLFIRYDRNKDLYLDSAGQLAEIFQSLKIQISPQHCTDLFMNGLRNQKFAYMQFLRYFISPTILFLKSCKFFIGHLCNGSFDKFYERGRVKNKKKWNLQSFNQINEQFLLGFTYNQIGEIWKEVNKQGQQSLTKKQVADIFDQYCEPQQAILGIDSQTKPKEKSIISKNSKREQEFKKSLNQKQTKQKKQHKNQLAQALLDKNMNQMVLIFIKKSKYTGEITLNDFFSCLNQLNLKYLEKSVLKSTTLFQIVDQKNGNSMKINYFNFIMYACELVGQQQKEKKKAQFISIVLNEFMRYYQKSPQDVFKKCKKSGVMKLLDYENLVRQLVKSQVYFDDIQDSWKSWGYPDYLTIEDFNKILGNKSNYRQSFKAPAPIDNKMNKKFSFNNRDQRKRDQDPIIQSPRFSKNNRSRKQSQTSKNENITVNQPKFRQTQRSHRLNMNSQDIKRQKQKQRQAVKVMQNVLQAPIIQQQKKKSFQLKQSQNQKRYDKKQQRRKQKQLTKEQVLQKFQQRLKQQGSDSLNSLFMKSNAVGFNQFVDFIQQNYNMTNAQATKLAEALSSFGKIKIDTVKKYLKKLQSSSSKFMKNNQTQSFTNKRQTSFKRQSPKRRDLQRQQKQRVQNQMKESQNQRYRLEDPKKLRINIPLVKQHIKILVGSFTKRFDLNQMQPYFFQGNTSIDKQLFIKKCLQINSSISRSMYQKIFAYLKPKQGLISSVAFKLSFSFDEQVTYQQTYLPQQIDQQIKAIFEKADKDKSGFIQYNQIEHILSSMGINQTQKQIQTYFSRIDHNNDKKIQLKQFKTFIQENILPLISDFDEDVDTLTGMLKLNDVFRTGYLPVTTIGAVLQRYGVKIGQKDLNTLNRFVANQGGQISIKQFINKLYFPSQQGNPPSLKAVLYRIRWKRRISFRQIQKIFENISASFVLSYTAQVIKEKIVQPSTFIRPILNESRFFYNDFYYKNFNKIQEKAPNLVSTPKPNDLIVELRMMDASGIPIPQNQTIKNSILNRSVNVTFFDTSNEQAKDCILNLKVQFDPDIQDQWVFDKNNRSIFIKISNYQSRKYQKIFILCQFLVTMVDGSKSIDISCGTASFPLKDLQVQSKLTKKYKMIAGLPNKAKDIDKTSISKRKGFFGFIGNTGVDTQLQVQIIPQSKISQKLQLICILPQKSIVNRKALHLMWTFRQYFAYRSADQKRINPDFVNHFIVRTFLLCLDIPDVNQQLFPFWKDRIQPKINTIDISLKIFHNLMLDLYVIIHSKQFQLLPSYPSKSTYMNKTLKNVRKKLLEQVFRNIQDWVLDDAKKDYKRKKAYNVDSTPFIIQQKQLSQQTKLISQQLAKIK